MNTISSMGDAATFKALVEKTITSFEDDQLTTIGGDAFRACTQLTSINLPAVTSIGNYAFYGCTGLYNISLPLVESLGDYAFGSCNSNQLTSLTLPSVEYLGNNAFYNCSHLQRIELPSITGIGNETFASCTALTALVIRNTDDVVPIGNNLLNNANNAIIYVPDALVDSYKTAPNWATYFNRIKGLSELPNS